MTLDKTVTTTPTAGLSAEQSALLDDIVRSLCFIRPAVLADDLDLVGDLGYDSLGLLELVTAIETEFALDAIDEQASLDVRSVGELRQLLVESLA